METTSTVSTTWGALKRVLALSYPIIAANLSQIVMGFVDTAMISRVSTDALASATAMCRAVYAGLGETSVAMRMTVLVNVINIPLNYIFIFALGWGLLGAGVGTALAVAVGCVYMGQFGWRRLRRAYDMFRVRRLRERWEALPRLWSIGWPETAMLFLGYVNNVLVIGIVASLGASVIAGMQIVTNVQQVLWTIIWALSTGVSILVGQSLGRRDQRAVALTERAGLLLMVVLPALLLAPLLVAPSTILRLLTPDGDVITETGRVLPILALQAPLMASSMALAAVLRAAGDSRWIFYTSTASSYLVMVPLSWLLAIAFGFGLPGVYLAGIAFFAARTAGTWWRYRQGKWRTTEL